MSVVAITWAFTQTAVKSPTTQLVLIALADHAGPDGTAAFPSIERLCRFTRLSERAVREHLRQLEELGLISPCDPRIVAAHIPRADRRPNGWNLNMDGGHVTPPAKATGGISRPDGGHLAPKRGASRAPEPSIEPLLEPSFKEPAPNGALDARQVTAAYIDAFRSALRSDPPQAVIGRVGREAKRLLAEPGVRLDLVLKAAQQAAESGHSNIHAAYVRALSAGNAEPKGWSAVRQVLREEGEP